MQHKRIQKLLLSEYCDFSDKILIESPFAETTRDGLGLCQVALGLTPSKLVIAADILKNNSEFTCPTDLDPSIESLELVSIYPLEFIALSVFCRRKRKTLKARLVDGRAKYYELGGMEGRNVYWALWTENVRELNEMKREGSSLSETTAASSSSASTIYLFSSGFEAKNKNNEEGGGSIWTRYGGAGDGQACSWRRKDIYLGPSYEELSQNYYRPVPVRFAGATFEQISQELRDETPKNLVLGGNRTCTTNGCSNSWPCTRVSIRKCVRFDRAGGTREIIKKARRSRQTIDAEGSGMLNRTIPEWESNNEARGTFSKAERRRIIPGALFAKVNGGIRQKHKSGSPRRHANTVAPKLSRFGFGVGENCLSGLYLEPWQGDKQVFRLRSEARMNLSSSPPSPPSPPSPRTLIESSICVWENPGEEKFRQKKRARHPRRYALATAAHFFHALGPWSVQPGERESVQRQRACSTVSIRRQPVESELRLPVSKRQLAASVSMTGLDRAKTGSVFSSSSNKARVILFWTPEYWYRPRAAAVAYKQLRNHLALIREFRTRKEDDGKIRAGYLCGIGRNNCQNDGHRTLGEPSSGHLLRRIFSSGETRKRDKRKAADRTSVKTAGGASQLRRLLRMDLRITAWDFDSWTIARQLTLIDCELFLRIPCAEIDVLLNEKSSRNAPNLGAWIAFGHRISCLTASEVLATKKLDMRTRILSRFINAADKCYALGNFHSCRSILAGLESPPIYRLNATWSRLRSHHSTRYEAMQRLCLIYRNTRSKSYRRAWQKCERHPPFLPYVGHLLDRIIYQDDYKGSAGNSPERKSEMKSKIGVIGNLDETKKPLLVERRKSLSERIVSKAISQLRYPILLARRPYIKLNKNGDEPPWTTKERELAKKFYTNWRRSILTAKILAEKEAKIRAMDPKKLRVITIGYWLCECQKHCQKYHFPGHPLASEFLLKARYREDRDNFFISLKLEPPYG
ncbi:uncharacterized protein [Venturia canescens]|uniref:uncharacterized protein n=1 Tax=Venturia canescens TaxID=32260 RepID=UPI001C9C3949|nr:uncharacterized protein LOC122418351 [Venturia canescens]